MSSLSERDWKLLSRSVKPAALERLCEQILADVKQVASDSQLTHHQRYGKVFGLIQQRDKTIANVFDGISRSNALIRLMLMRREQLVTDEELASFSPETQMAVTEATRGK